MRTNNYVLCSFIVLSILSETNSPSIIFTNCSSKLDGRHQSAFFFLKKNASLFIMCPGSRQKNPTNIENIDTEAKRCFATHDEDESWLDECRKIVYTQSHAYIFNSSTLFNNVPMAQWSTLMPCNREATGSNLSGVLAFI